MITIDITLLIHIINIIVLMLVLNAILYKPILGILERRAQHLEGLQGEVAKFESDAKTQQAELDRKIREAGAKAKKALDEAKAQAQAAASRQLAEKRALADEEKNKALESARKDTETARKALLDDTAEFARAMAEKILGRSLNA